MERLPDRFLGCRSVYLFCTFLRLISGVIKGIDKQYQLVKIDIILLAWNVLKKTAKEVATTGFGIDPFSERKMVARQQHARDAVRRITFSLMEERRKR